MLHGVSNYVSKEVRGPKTTSHTPENLKLESRTLSVTFIFSFPFGT